MSKKIRVVLVPDTNHVQLLLDTMGRYFELCNYISQIVFDHGKSRPINLYYWKLTSEDDNFYRQVRREFPDINSNMITMAFRRVGKA